MTDKDESPVAQMAASMGEFMDAIAILREAAMGYKVQLEADGWSPTMAEQIAAAMLVDLQRKGINQ